MRATHHVHGALPVLSREFPGELGAGFLARAQHHGVRGDDPFDPVLGVRVAGLRRIPLRGRQDVHALFVDPHVLHPGYELHVRHAQFGAVDPPRGGAQSRSGLTGAALQQGHAPSRFRRRRGEQPAPCFQRAVHSPLGVEVGVRVVREEVRDVEPDPAAADDRHSLTHGGAGQDVLVPEHRGAVLPGDAGDARGHAGGHDHAVREGHVLRGGGVPRAHGDPQLGQARAEVAHGVGVVLFARDAQRQLELAAQLRLLLEQGHPVTPLRRSLREGQPSRSGTHHRDPLRGARGAQHQLLLAHRARVHEA